MKKLLMIGGGVSGNAVAELSAALDIECCVTSDVQAAQEDLDKIFAGVDLVVVSPGVLPTSKLYNAAVERNIEVISELELGVRYFPGPMVAVTGTNGKTTTVELTEFILNKLGVRAVAAGNIGLPLSAVSAKILRGEIAHAEELVAVLEVSSFQLKHTHQLPAVAAVLLNIESDHINRYPGGISEYQAVKERIFAQVPPENRFYGMSMSGRNQCGKFAIAANQLYCENSVLLDLSESALSAPHNQENLLAAISLCSCVTDLSVQKSELAAAVREFKTGDHRISLVAEKNGVKYIDDSKATNPAAVIAAVKSLQKQMQNNIILIAGGLDKDMDFAPLAALSKYLKKVIVYGRCGNRIAGVFAGKNEVFDAGSDFALAVKTAHASAESGDIVLLSPAAASMDMFKDYKERGNKFAELVSKL
ncbi:MAG: UDP-N-acetylmuramoyl-L-alanine--D-glutamate ligase [Lentisphaerae bacterium]|nr:UDP-N-acetylmuramoyl-L-alanine--D-glutamate ligase [Lentisphaerota bacterium]